MNERKKRINEVYNHLRRFFDIHTQGDFAKAIHYSRPVVSLALNGDEKSLTNELLESVCDAFPGVFNKEYLLNGVGDLLTIEEDAKSEEIEKESRKDETIDFLRSQLAKKDDMIKRLLSQMEAKDQHIVRLNDQIENLWSLVELNKKSN